MKDLAKDNKGDSYGVYAVILFIFLAGAFIFLMTNVFNGFLTPFNQFISAGMVSQQTRDSMNFIYLVLGSMPFFAIIGATLWGWIHALEKKREGG